MVSLYMLGDSARSRNKPVKQVGVNLVARFCQDLCYSRSRQKGSDAILLCNDEHDCRYDDLIYTFNLGFHMV